MNHSEVIYDIKFEKVSGTTKQISILFSLLSDRVHSISHTKLPTYKEHEKFVKENPYKDWFIIFQKISVIGAFYVKHDNSIGLNLIHNKIDILSAVLSFIKSNLTPCIAKASEIPPYFFINIPSSNHELKNVFKKLNINSIQESYRI